MNYWDSDIEVWAGPDDFTFERDRFLWIQWIKQNITPAGFRVLAHPTNAAKAIVKFENKKWNLIFQLKAPEYIEPSMVRVEGHWIIGKDSP